MTMPLLALVPKKLWLTFGALLLVTLTLTFVYRAGISSANAEWELLTEKMVNEKVNIKLKETSLMLEEALEIKAENDSLIREHNNQQLKSKASYEALQVQLDEILKTPTTIEDDSCSQLTTPYIRLYQSMYNKEPTARTDNSD